MPEIAVVNASPIITLAKSDHLTLIPESSFIPEAMIQEIVKGPMGDPARQAITAGWGKHRIEVILEPSVVEWGLGPGETEVLSCAIQKRCVAVIDDRAARIAARTLGIFSSAQSVLFCGPINRVKLSRPKKCYRIYPGPVFMEKSFGMHY